MKKEEYLWRGATVVLFILIVSYAFTHRISWNNKTYCSRVQPIYSLNKSNGEFNCLLNNCTKVGNKMQADISRCWCDASKTYIYTYCTDRFKGEEYARNVEDLMDVVAKHNAGS